MTRAPLPDAHGPDTSLAETLHRLWPGSDVEVVRSSRRSPDARTELIAFPDLARHRLLLPASARGAGAAVHRFSAATGRVEVGARVLARSALQHGATSLLRDRIRLHGSEESIVDHLAEVLGHDEVQVSLSLGPPRVNRKPVLQVFDVAGRSLAFAKVGTTTSAATVVTDESRSLGLVAEHEFRTLRVPRVLGMHHWRDMPVLVQEDLAVSAASLLRGTASSPATAMAELTAAFAGTPVPLPDSGWWQTCRTRAREAADPSQRDHLLAAMDTLAARHPGPVQVSAWHGDWTPWNTAPSPGSTLVWDWERFETGAPTGLDAVHYAVNTATTRDGDDTEVIARAVRASAPDLLTGALYLVAVASRYLAMTGEEHGALVTPRAGHTLRALTGLLDERPGP